MNKKLISIAIIIFEIINTTEWNYLTTEPFRTRYAIAAYLLRDCEEIIEIGGYKTPISDFISNKKILVIDPLVAPKNTQNILHLAIPFQNWTGSTSTKNYGVAILGLELHMPDSAWQNLFKLIDQSKRTVLEVPDFETSELQFKKIVKNTSKKIRFTIHLDLTENDYSTIGKDSYPPRCKRNIFVLE